MINIVSTFRSAGRKPGEGWGDSLAGLGELLLSSVTPYSRSPVFVSPVRLFTISEQS